ncbi:MAG: GGDEF domain-containing protein [Comamonas sp.]|nr:GGDEF domain-containing protein [Comamonas sp.]
MSLDSIAARTRLQRWLDLLLTTEPRLRASLVTTGWACLLMVCCIFSLELGAAAGLADPRLVRWWSLGSGACVLISFVLIRSGISRGWRDPAFTHVQTAYAITSNAVAYAIADQARGITPPVLAVIMMFGVFGLRPAQIKVLMVYGLLAYGVAAALVQCWEPLGAMPVELAAMYLLIVAVVLFTSTALTLRAHAMREHLQSRKRDLSQAVEQVRELATRDELTGLPNRRHMQEMMRLEAMRAARSGQPLLMAQLDLDAFKAINDTHGHGAGDLVLQSFARLVSGCVRSADILARWGGEEFVLLMCNTSAQDGRYLLERVRSAVAATPVQLPAGAAVGLTVSVGAAQFLEGEELASLLERADEALYAAKRLGRNRVVWATR